MKKIQVLERAFAVLEMMAKGSGRVHTLSELIHASGLKAPTMVHILQTLVSLGYVEHLGRKKGYVLGSGVYALARGERYQDPLAAAKPYLEEFSLNTGEYIALSVLRDGQRIIVHHIRSTKSVQVDTPMQERETPYRSVSGRLLLASLPEALQRKHFRQYGLPGELWPEISSEADFVMELSSIRAQGKVISITNDLTSIAIPIRVKGAVIAALGVFLPSYRFKTEQRKAILSLLAHTAEKISDHFDERLDSNVSGTTDKPSTARSKMKDDKK
ncbi:MAG: IclR family transcriptional regulator [Spirochaetota bacterium]